MDEFLRQFCVLDLLGILPAYLELRGTNILFPFFIVPLFIEFSLNLVNTFFHFPSEFVFLFGKHWFFFSCFFQWTLKLKCLFLFNFFFCTLDSLSAQQEQGALLDYCCFKAAERKSWPHFIICMPFLHRLQLSSFTHKGNPKFSAFEGSIRKHFNFFSIS